MLRFIPDNEGFRSDLVVDTNEKLRVGIIDADLLDYGTRHPHLALLKISVGGYLIEKTNKTSFIQNNNVSLQAIKLI